MNCSRRDLGLIIPLLASGTATAEEAKGLPSRVFKYDELPVKTNGENKSRAVLKGESHSGFPIELHLTELGPGQAPHAPHKHVHEECLMLKIGSLDATIEGQTTRLTAGSIIYVASNEMHGLRNPGPGPAEYFVIALGNNT
jgi:mannose-6-phosphate isomerase-like protein (cupin superfamily)